MMTRLRGSARPTERGAVAVMVAVLASVLVIVAGLSVDLGNAWARGRIVQKQADVSALAAGSLLPMSTDPNKGSSAQAIAERAAEYLNQNVTPGQQMVAWTALTDGDTTNGHLVFQTADGNACDGSSDVCTRMTLTPPQARVDFGLASIVSPGADVTRSATVELFSGLPPRQQVVPLWLPSGCGYGPVDGDSSQGPSSPTTTTSTVTASPSSSPTPIAIDPVGTHTLSGPTAYTLPYGGSLNITNLTITNVSNGTKKASVRAISPNGTLFIEYAAADVKSNSSTFNVADFTIGQEVSQTPGTWKLYAVIQKGSQNAYSQNMVTLQVQGGPTASPSSPSVTATASPSSVPVGCTGQDRGNFGQLFSPRLDTSANSKSAALARNLAFGLDHLPIPFDQDAYAIQKECAHSNGNNPIPGAQLDDESRDGNNCIIGDTGNDGPKLYDGLIGMVDGKPGRLNVLGDSGRETTCPSRSNKAYGSHSVNNDVLSCFLRGTGTLDKLAQESGVDQSMLDPAIVKSPRLVYIPMIYATDRAQKGYQPIVDYVPAFITDETQTAPASAENGLEVDGNSVKVIRLFAFNKAALPPNYQSPDVDYDPTLGSGNVRLIG